MKILLLKFGLICLLLSGCMTPTHLVYVHGTTVGLDVAASTEGTGRLVFGYDRDTFAIIPHKNNNKESDAMSLAAVSCIYAWGLDDVQFKHFVSTGEAATKLVKNPVVLSQIWDSIQGGGENCEPKENKKINTTEGVK